MTTNPFFTSYEEESEQDLLEDLITEYIQIGGQDMKYVPRELANFDRLFGADDSSRYDETYGIEMYVKSILGFGGDKDFFSQFGHQIRDEVVFTVSKTRFELEVGAHTGQDTPNEGDLIYFPMNEKCFVIKFVDPREMFYQLGKVYTYELTCEVFEYSGETIDTGDEEVDSLTELSINALDWAVVDESGNVVVDEYGNVVVHDFDLSLVDPGTNNDYLEENVEDETEFDPRVEDPFGFATHQ